MEYFIQVKMDESDYAIGELFSQLTSNYLGQRHLMAFFSQKMIPAKTQYKTHDNKLLAIVKAFNTWKYYLKGFQHKVFILTNYNNF